MKKLLLKNSPTILKNTDFQSILIKVMFPFEETEENLAKIQLLPCLLNTMSEHYPTEEAFQKEKKRLYILGTNCFKTIIGTTGCFVFNLIIPDTKALGRDLLEEQFQFFQEVLYHPMIKNGGFLEEELEREKRNIRMGMDNALKNIRPYQSIKVRELMDDEGILSRDLIHTPELLDNVTTQDLYEFYLDMIQKNQPAIYVMGNVDSKRITDLCHSYLYLKSYSEKEVAANLFYFLKPRETVLEVEERSTFKDSSLSFVYKVRDMTEDDVLLLNLIRDLLTSLSSRILGQKLRSEKDLIYSSKVLPYPHFGCFEITIFLNPNHVLEGKEILSTVLMELKNTKYIEPFLQNIKERKRLNLLRKLDDKYLIMEDFVLQDLGVDDTMEESYEKIVAITAKDISSFVDRLVLDTIYFLKEGENE